MKTDDAKTLIDTAVGELAAALEAGRSERLTAMLAAMARFHAYSFGNVMLILAQRPDATRVAGYRLWLSLGRQVRKGERAIRILAPLVRKVEDEDSTEGPKRRVVGFRSVCVFDLAQTEGGELPTIAATTGDPGDALDRLLAFAADRGITVSFTDELRGDGVSKMGEIGVRASLSPAGRFSVLVHELAHEILHDAEARRTLPKTVAELEAEAVAFVVSSAVGLECAESSSDYIQLYRGDAETLRASLDRISQAAASILDAVLSEAV